MTIKSISMAILLITTLVGASVQADTVSVNDSVPAAGAPLLQTLRTQVKEELGQHVLTVLLHPSSNERDQATKALQAYIETHPQDTVAKMYYGYGQLFLAGDYLKKKNYLRVAESAKRGFFFMDEAAETDLDNWRLRFVRLRMDAFVPAEGRCVVAIKDATYLHAATTIPAELQPFITFMQARAYSSCGKQDLADAAYQSLKQAGKRGAALLALPKDAIPPLSEDEVKLVLQPLLGVAS